MYSVSVPESVSMGDMNGLGVVGGVGGVSGLGGETGLGQVWPYSEVRSLGWPVVTGPKVSQPLWSFPSRHGVTANF